MARDIPTVTLINLSGPSGAGKDTLLDFLAERLGSRAWRVPTITTRPLTRGFDPSYTSLTDAAFDAATLHGSWLITQQVGGAVRYGTNLDQVHEVTSGGLVGLHSVYAGPAGAGRLREIFGLHLMSFGVRATRGPLDAELCELTSRLTLRSRDSVEVIDRRRDDQIDTIGYLERNPLVDSPNGPRRVFDRVLVNASLADAERAAVSALAPRLRSTVGLAESYATRGADAVDSGRVGGSYLPVDATMKLGRALLGAGKEGPSDPVVRYAALVSRLRPHESLVALYERRDGRKLSPLLYSAARLHDFESQLDDTLLQSAKYFGVPRADLSDHLSL